MVGVHWYSAPAGTSCSAACRCPVTRTVRPRVSGHSSSRTLMSKDRLVPATVNGAPGRARSHASKSAVSRACPTTTPLGRPVEPEVCRMYARPAGSAGAASPPSPSTGTAAPASAMSRGRTPGASRSAPGRARSPRTTAGAVSATMNRSRSAGYSGSSGTYTAPARQTASTATTRSVPRGRQMPTRSPGRTPRPVSARATARDRRSRAA